MELEFSRLFPVDKLRDRPMREHIEANDEEREALAKRMEIVAINALTADVNLQRVHSGKMVEVSGSFAADVVQNCVVTLEPFETHIEEKFTAYFVRHDEVPNAEEVQIDEDRSPEAIAPNGEIDLGELTAQHLALELDPYPRKPGAVFVPPEEVGVEEEKEEVKTSPFAVLADYKKKKQDKSGK